MRDYVKDTIARAELENGENWNDILKEVPILNFDKEWDIQIIPPFGGAVARFRVFKNGEQVCSVYLDWYERLAIFGEPYYELYPYEEDVRRYSLRETDELIEDIRKIYKDAK